MHRLGSASAPEDGLGDPAASVPADRYTLLRELGHGAFGTVYEAMDLRRNAQVALKVLEIHDAEARYRFKREFRALARLSHPNLVTLYELHAATESWFFTMELVAGIDFVAHARADLGRLRSATWQLVRAVLALHQAGMLHCDIKPSNVLVTPSGRVVVLDFGLVADLDGNVADADRSQVLIGTPAYMSPEQCSNTPLTPASDWYAVGVMLYEALTGALPHDGHSLQILSDKKAAPPRPIHELAPDTPEDLARLCMELLSADPAARPSGISLLRRLDRRRGERAPTAYPPGHVHVRALTETVREPDGGEPFVGRARDRAALEQVLARSQTGLAQAVLVGGSSGIGKTALARRFLDDLVAAGEVVVVAGACYPREFVPYKGMDSLVDGLARVLGGMREDELRAVAPADVRALSRLFPVMTRLHAHAPLADLPPLQGDPRELRRRAFDALRLLILRLATARPMVLFLDDLQWMDADALAWLGHVLGPPAAPPLLFLGTYERSERAAEHPLAPLLQRLGQPVVTLSENAPSGDAAPRAAIPASAIIDIALGPLTAEDSRRAAEVLLARRSSPAIAAPAAPAPAPAPAIPAPAIPAPAPVTPAPAPAPATTAPAPAAPELAASVAAASGGHPFLLVQLAAHVEPALARPDTGGRAGTGPEATIMSKTGGEAVTVVIRRILDRLSVPARRLLELIAVAGRPVPQSAVADAAALHVHEVDVLAPLAAERLVRLLEIDDHEYVDVYLDCIRETALAALQGDALARHHRRLAHALLRFGAPAEWLHVHFRGAGEHARAAQFAEQAGDRAALALAFERAAACYRDAIALGSQSERVHEKLGDVLAHGGRGADAADAYLTALRYSPRTRLPEIRRRAAEQLLRIGHLEPGLTELRAVLADVGMRLGSRWGALARAALRRAWLRVRGLGFRARKAEDCDPQALLELDACWSASTLLGMVDTVLGADFQSRHLHRALAVGEPLRVARALASEVVYTAAPGHRQRARARALAARVADMAAKLGDDYLSAFALLAEGMAVFLADFDWPLALETFERAEDVLRERCVGVDWERDTAMVFSLNSLYWLGAFDEITRRHPLLLERARARGDLYAEDALESSFSTAVLLAADRPDELRRRQAGFQTRDGSISALVAWWSQLSLCEADLYEGHGDVCLRRILRAWPRFVGSFVSHVQLARIVSVYTRARAALCAVAARPRGTRARLLRWLARRDARILGRQGPPFAQGLAACIHAGLAVQQGDTAAALRFLDSARQAFESTHTFIHARAVSYCQGALRGDAAGRALMEESERMMADAQVRAPERVVRWLLPGVLPAAPAAVLPG
ncbi:MAG TPA: protein kinase [Haliangium sp.]|nr:protein kinase [Haliangium sp.]